MARRPLTVIGPRLASKVLTYRRIKECSDDDDGIKWSANGYKYVGMERMGKGIHSIFNYQSWSLNRREERGRKDRRRMRRLRFVLKGMIHEIYIKG